MTITEQRASDLSLWMFVRSGVCGRRDIYTCQTWRSQWGGGRQAPPGFKMSPRLQRLHNRCIYNLLMDITLNGLMLEGNQFTVSSKQQADVAVRNSDSVQDRCRRQGNFHFISCVPNGQASVSRPHWLDKADWRLYSEGCLGSGFWAGKEPRYRGLQTWHTFRLPVCK